MRPHYPSLLVVKHRSERFVQAENGKISFMLTLLLLVLIVVLLLGGIGPRYYRGRGPRRVVREYETY